MPLCVWITTDCNNVNPKGSKHTHKRGDKSNGISVVELPHVG